MYFSVCASTIVGRKEIFYLTMHSTHFVYCYMASDVMVKDHSDSERGIPPHGLLFPISSKGSFIYSIPHIGYAIITAVCLTKIINPLFYSPPIYPISNSDKFDHRDVCYGHPRWKTNWI